MKNILDPQQGGDQTAPLGAELINNRVNLS
jgi:hypothetical protein